MKALPAALGVLCLVVACASGSGSQSSAVQPAGGPSGVLLGSPPDGFADKLDTGLNLQAAGAATPAQPAATRQALNAGGYSAGQERIWTRGSEYVTAIGLEFSTDIDAASFAHFELTQIGASPAATEGSFNDIPGASQFSLYGLTRQGSRQTFCQGIWFAAARYAFELLDCADAPRYPDLVAGLAKQQYSRVPSG